MVELINGLTSGIQRSIAFIHMPVPIERDDDAFYRPLQLLKIQPSTEIYLGLIHDTDGVAGTVKRMATAHRYIGDFGIATECGFGRRPPETVPALIELHASLLARA